MRNSHLLLCGRIGGLNLIVSRYVVILRQLGRRDLKCCVWQTTQRCISPNGSICVSFSFAVKLNTAQSKLGVLKSNVHKRHLCSCARALPFSTVNTKMPIRSRRGGESSTAVCLPSVVLLSITALFSHQHQTISSLIHPTG